MLFVGSHVTKYFSWNTTIEKSCTVTSSWEIMRDVFSKKNQITTSVFGKGIPFWLTLLYSTVYPVEMKDNHILECISKSFNLRQHSPLFVKIWLDYYVHLCPSYQYIIIRKKVLIMSQWSMVTHRSLEVSSPGDSQTLAVKGPEQPNLTIKLSLLLEVDWIK